MLKQNNISVIAAFALVLTLLTGSNINAGLVVEFNTNFGAFEVELFDTQKPVSVNNFLAYANGGYYDNTVIHRSISNFIIQGGGYQTTGAAIPTFGQISNEIGLSNLRGTIAYANTGSPDSATSQWYFNVADNTFLDTGYTVFGQVRGSGMNIVDFINSLPTVNIGGPFTDLPVLNSSAPLYPSNLAVIHSITPIANPSVSVPEPGSLLLLLVGMTSFMRRNRSRGE